MKVGSLVVLFFCLVLAAAAIEPKKRLLINEVLELTDARGVVEVLRQQQVELVRQTLVREAEGEANATYVKLGIERMTAKYDDYSKLQFSWYRIEEKYAAIYDRAFTESQLRALVAFLKTDAGRAMLASGPDLAGILQQQIAATAEETKAKVAQLFEQARAEVDQQMRLDAQKLVNAPIDEVEVMARGGNSAAQFLMGTYLLEGTHTEKNPAEAVKWLKLAVAQKHSAAQARLGWCYALGEGVEKDEARAREFFSASAATGNTAAEYSFAMMLSRGTGGEKDVTQAFPLFLKAANAGHTRAQYEVAVRYWNGEGVERNLIEAYAWAFVAKESGWEEATKLYEHIHDRIGFDNLADAGMRGVELRREVAARNARTK